MFCNGVISMFLVNQTAKDLINKLSKKWISENENSLSFETVKQKDISKCALNTVLYLFIFAF